MQFLKAFSIWLSWFLIPYIAFTLIILLIWFLISFTSWNWDYESLIHSFQQLQHILFSIIRLMTLVWAIVCIGIEEETKTYPWNYRT